MTETSNVKIGINILETLTTGMYRDPFVMYREYIQNSCDAIDEAVYNNLLSFEDGRIDIWLNDNSLIIEDNGIGIPRDDFRTILYSIGESGKNANVNRGFRGIGHWCGFANCSTLIFTAKAAGENVESVMVCDAEKIRLMMYEHRVKTKSHSINDVLSEAIIFSENVIDDSNSHYFKVKMEGIDLDDELYDLQKIKDYLSFIAPVDYATEFIFRDKIINFSDSIGHKLSQYKIYIEGEPILKKYQLTFDTRSKGKDEIFDVDFKEIKDDNGNLIAWLWYGISTFKAQIIPSCKMRGIRLRCKNIQLGDESALQHLFSETRGINYFVGEVFAVSNDLIPDSQRDYFEPCQARVQFDMLLSRFFHDHLKNIYYTGSSINSALKNYDDAHQALENYKNQTNLTEIQQDKINTLEKNYEKAKQNLEKVQKKIDKHGASGNNTTSEMFKRAKKQHKEMVKQNKVKSDENRIDSQKSSDDKNSHINNTVITNSNQDKMISLQKIIEIIKKILDNDTANKIIKEIKEELN